MDYKGLVKASPPRSRVKPRCFAAFTIVEMMMVLAILGALSMLTVGAFNVVQSYQITSSAAEFKAVTALARQTAITSGKAVELRLYKANADTPHYSGYRIFKPADLQGSQARIGSKMRRLPDGIVMRASAAGSTVLAAAPEETETAVAGFSGEDVKVIGFRPNGALNLPPPPGQGTWAVTFAAEKTPAVANDLPANFATVSFDVLLGTTEVYRP